MDFKKLKHKDCKKKTVSDASAVRVQLLCNEEASQVPPVDGAGSRVAVVATHLSRLPDQQHLQQVAYQPHPSLVGNQDSYLRLRSMEACLPEWCCFC